MITIAQCRAARGLLGWTQQDLAEACGLSKTAINNFEKGHSDIKNESLRAIRMAFESADVEFTSDEGLRRKTENIQTLKGANAFGGLLSDVCDTLKGVGGEVLISHIDEQITGQVSSKQMLDFLDFMESHEITPRILCPEGSSTILAPLSACRWLPRTARTQRMMMFIYGQKVALELWDGSMIVIVNSREASNAERVRFEHLWNEAAVPAADNKKAAGQSS